MGEDLGKDLGKDLGNERGAMSTILDILASIPANTPVICAPGRRDLDGRDLRTAVANFRAAVPGGSMTVVWLS